MPLSKETCMSANFKFTCLLVVAVFISLRRNDKTPRQEKLKSPQFVASIPQFAEGCQIFFAFHYQLI
jgi:hypothetical protein